jgi:predicted  nucleic acid-binding Zn-ribbon protein
MDKCVDCGHVLEDHDADSGVMIGACYECDCEGYKARDEYEESLDSR